MSSLPESDPRLLTAQRARMAVAGYFFANGSAVGGWVPHVPDKARELGFNPAQLGLTLLAAGCGAVLAMPLAGWLTSKVGSRRVAFVGGSLMPIALWCMVLAPAAWMMAAALFAFGMAGASMDVAMNSQGILVEERLGYRTISLFHGVWSVGGVLGSAVSAAALSRGARPALVITVLAAGLIAVAVSLHGLMLGHEQRRHMDANI